MYGSFEGDERRIEKKTIIIKGRREEGTRIGTMAKQRIFSMEGQAKYNNLQNS